MTASLLDDALAHHVWATERLIDACSELSSDQLEAPSPGTYGSIIETVRHLVATDRWYLTFFAVEQRPPIDEKGDTGLTALREVITGNGPLWTEVLGAALNGDEDTIERGDSWVFHAPLGLRLAQVVHHGTDHRSQVCTALTSLGVAPPDIDLWAYGEATGRTRAEHPTEG